MNLRGFSEKTQRYYIRVVARFAAFLGRSTSWVYKAAERGELPRARGMGWGLRFVPSELHAYARGEMSGPRAMIRKREGGA